MLLLSGGIILVPPVIRLATSKSESTRQQVRRSEHMTSSGSSHQLWGSSQMLLVQRRILRLCKQEPVKGRDQRLGTSLCVSVSPILVAYVRQRVVVTESQISFAPYNMFSIFSERASNISLRATFPSRLPLARSLGRWSRCPAHACTPPALDPCRRQPAQQTRASRRQHPKRSTGRQSRAMTLLLVIVCRCSRLCRCAALQGQRHLRPKVRLCMRQIIHIISSLIRWIACTYIAPKVR